MVILLFDSPWASSQRIKKETFPEKTSSTATTTEEEKISQERGGVERN
jgi:hypothetical protein